MVKLRTHTNCSRFFTRLYIIRAGIRTVRSSSHCSFVVAFLRRFLISFQGVNTLYLHNIMTKIRYKIFRLFRYAYPSSSLACTSGRLSFAVGERYYCVYFLSAISFHVRTYIRRRLIPYYDSGPLHKHQIYIRPIFHSAVAVQYRSHRNANPINLEPTATGRCRQKQI